MANLIPFGRRVLREQWSPWEDVAEIASLLWDKSMVPSGMAYPAVDVQDTPEAFIVKADVPGYTKADLEVELDANVVTIKGNRVSEKKTDSQDFIHQERQVGEFRRTFALPMDIDVEKAEATFDDGVLEIRLPKLGSKGRRLTIS